MLRTSITMSRKEEGFVRQQAQRYGYSISGYFRRLVLDEIERYRSRNREEKAYEARQEFDNDIMEHDSKRSRGEREEMGDDNVE